METKSNFLFDLREFFGLVPKKACPFCKMMHGIKEAKINEHGNHIVLMTCPRYGMVEVTYKLVERWSWKP